MDNATSLLEEVPDCDRARANLIISRNDTVGSVEVLPDHNTDVVIKMAREANNYYPTEWITFR